jgi:type IV secretion system protein VirD4
MSSTFAKALFAATYLALAACMAPYLAGAIYFVSNKRMPIHIGWNTWVNYWSIYHLDALQHPRLVLSAALALIIVLVLPVVATFASLGKRRSLHGDARWANDAEIRKAGLS